MEHTNIPDFMQKYHQGINHEGQDEINQLAGKYEEDRAVFLQTTFVEKQQFQRDWNKLTGQRKELTADEALKPMQAEYLEKTQAIATKYGYQEKAQDKIEQKEQQETPQQARVAFTQKLNAQRAHQSQRQQNKEQSQSTNVSPKPTLQTDKERFAAKLTAMKQAQQNITLKPIS